MTGDKPAARPSRVSPAQAARILADRDPVIARLIAEALGEPFRPYRSVVAWYCWRAAQLYAGAQASAVTS
jgi:3-methyladenine DNA glycosylase/8-oxoguanine DNA glycosylase